MKNRTVRTALLGSWVILAWGCAPAASAQDAGDVSCPAGQKYDGQFCVVDQNVATLEQPVSGEATQNGGSSQPAEHTGETKSDEPAPEEPPDKGKEGGDAEDSPSEADQSPESTNGESEPEEVEPKEAAEIDIAALPAAASVDYAMAAQAAPVMHYLASSHLPAGARPLGTPFAGQFAEGQALTKKVQLTAGKCYTIVGMGLPPVTELDLKLLDPLGEDILASDEMSGPQAVIGSRDKCFMADETKSVSLVLIATGGRGIAAAQVFQK